MNTSIKEPSRKGRLPSPGTLTRMALLVMVVVMLIGGAFFFHSAAAAPAHPTAGKQHATTLQTQTLNGGTRLSVFALGSDNKIWYRWIDDGSGAWSDWTSLGPSKFDNGDFKFSPSVVSDQQGRLFVFAQDESEYIEINMYEYGRWSGWWIMQVPGNRGTGVICADKCYYAGTGGPAVSSWGSGRLDVFINAHDSDGHFFVLLHAWLDQGQWHDFEKLGGNAEFGFWTDPPAAISWGSGRIDVFDRDHFGGDILWHKWFVNGQWSSWETLGGTTMSAPTVGSWLPGHLNVFVRNPNNGLSDRWSVNGQWSAWETLDGSFASAPAVASFGYGRWDVFARSANNTLLHKWYSNGGWSGWEDLGGIIQFDPATTVWNPTPLQLPDPTPTPPTCGVRGKPPCP